MNIAVSRVQLTAVHLPALTGFILRENWSQLGYWWSTVYLDPVVYVPSGTFPTSDQCPLQLLVTADVESLI